MIISKETAKRHAISQDPIHRQDDVPLLYIRLLKNITLKRIDPGKHVDSNDHHVTESADVKARKGPKEIEDDDPQLIWRRRNTLLISG